MLIGGAAPTRAEARSFSLPPAPPASRPRPVTRGSDGFKAQKRQVHSRLSFPFKRGRPGTRGLPGAGRRACGSGSNSGGTISPFARDQGPESGGHGSGGDRRDAHATDRPPSSRVKASIRADDGWQRRRRRGRFWNVTASATEVVEPPGPLFGELRPQHRRSVSAFFFFFFFERQQSGGSTTRRGTCNGIDEPRRATRCCR